MTSFIEEFHRVDGEYLRVAAEQASRFAKGVADDFTEMDVPLIKGGTTGRCGDGHIFVPDPLETMLINMGYSAGFGGLGGDRDDAQADAGEGGPNIACRPS